MGVIGTGIASAVAQTALQAQQVARERDRKARLASDEALRVRERIDEHMQALDEGDEAAQGSVTQFHVDGQLPQHTPPIPASSSHHARQDSPRAGDADGDNPHGSHLDVQA